MSIRDFVLSAYVGLVEFFKMFVFRIFLQVMGVVFGFFFLWLFFGLRSNSVETGHDRIEDVIAEASQVEILAIDPTPHAPEHRPPGEYLLGYRVLLRSTIFDAKQRRELANQLRDAALNGPWQFSKEPYQPEYGVVAVTSEHRLEMLLSFSNGETDIVLDGARAHWGFRTKGMSAHPQRLLDRYLREASRR